MPRNLKEQKQADPLLMTQRQSTLWGWYLGGRLGTDIAAPHNSPVHTSTTCCPCCRRQPLSLSLTLLQLDLCPRVPESRDLQEGSAPRDEAWPSGRADRSCWRKRPKSAAVSLSTHKEDSTWAARAARASWYSQLHCSTRLLNGSAARASWLPPVGRCVARAVRTLLVQFSWFLLQVYWHKTAFSLRPEQWHQQRLTRRSSGSDSEELLVFNVQPTGISRRYTDIKVDSPCGINGRY